MGFFAAVKRWFDGLPYEPPDYNTALAEERVKHATAVPVIVPEPASKPSRKPRVVKRKPRTK